jgi:hypothetical protein
VQAAPSVSTSLRTRRLRSADGAAVAAAVGIAVVAQAPALAGYASGGRSFTGSATAAKYVADEAQHELWAHEMARHGRLLTNLMTPERTHQGWFFNPLEFLLGLAERLTSVPYGMLGMVAALLGAPVLALGLVVLARRAGLHRPAVPVTVALLAGSFQPLVITARHLGIPGTSHFSGVGVDASAVAAGGWLYLPLAVLTLVFLTRPASLEPTCGFRRAGIALAVETAVYPFFFPALWLTGGFYAFVRARALGWRRMLPGILWFTALPAVPLVYYALILPHVDPEFSRFARLNYIPVYGPGGVVASLGLGLATVAGVPRLLRGNEARKVLGCAAIAIVVALCLPRHPDRSHVLYLEPVLVLGAFAAWWPALRTRRPGRWHIVAAVMTAAALVAAPYYYRSEVESLTPQTAPVFLSADDRAAFSWLARQHDDGVVLARTDIGPWVAARGYHHVIAGHYLWTHNWEQRSKDVDAVFDAGVDPRPLLRRFDVTWVVVDTERGTPPWARGIASAHRFGSTMVFAARQLTR